MTKFCSAFHEVLAFRQNRASKQEVGHCDLILLIDFFILIILKIKVQLPGNALYIIQPNISSGSGEKVNFSGLALFSNSGTFCFSTRLNFIILKPCSLVMLHVKFENRRCIDSTE